MLDDNSEIDRDLVKIFRKSKNNYGIRKIKVELGNLGYRVSKRIARIMKVNALVFNYTVA
ncbi:IS3 family transposase [Melaminivora alkalimesophila]|uniref:IS3 family transposase n=1 Tax=Melaminivora alkalimesophila TaxID=1165852 RepID=UPI0009DAC043